MNPTTPPPPLAASPLATDYELVLLALCVYREARSESRAAMAAVANSVYNRVLDPKHRWPRTLSGAIVQHEQFSSFNVDSADAVFPVLGSSQWSAWLACCDTVDDVSVEVSSGKRNDPTSGAQFYVSEEPDKWPPWTRSMAQTLHVGPFYFFRED